MKNVIKKVIPIKRVKVILYRLHLLIIRMLVKSKFLSSIYYLFNNKFRREQNSVLSGKLKHLEDMNNKSSNSFLLRRNIHRLEKGLLMKPMRKIFALDYIEETVLTYKSLLNDYHIGKDVSINELKWAYDVLKKYFDVTGSHEVINESREKFNELDHITFEIKSEKYIPYTRDLSKPSPVTFESLLELAKYRRSVRWFKNKEVPKHKIDNALNVANLSPSACNRQPYYFRFFDEPEELKKISRLPMGTRGYNDNIPVMAAVIGDLSAYPFERDRHLIYIDASLAVMAFILALETQGVSSCIINWPDIEEREKKITEFLNLKDYERVIMLIGLGYPDDTGQVAYSQKKDLNKIRSWN